MNFGKRRIAAMDKNAAQQAATAFQAAYQNEQYERQKLADEVEQLQAETDRLQAIINDRTTSIHGLQVEVKRLTAVTASLPHDALGNVLMPPAEMWTEEGKPYIVGCVERDGDCRMDRWMARQWTSWADREGNYYPCDELYPTREAAEIARKETVDV